MLLETSLVLRASSRNIWRVDTARRLQVDTAKDTVCGEGQVVDNVDTSKAALETAIFDKLLEAASDYIS